MNFDSIITEAKSLLEATLEGAYLSNIENNKSPIHISYAYRIARHINELARDYLMLEEQRGYHGAPIILRSILESVFSLGAISYDSSFAASKCITEINKLIEKLRSSDPALKSNLVELREKTCHDYNLSRDQSSLKIWEIAQLAGLKELYDFQYYWLSKATHPTLNGIISGESGGTAGFRASTLAFVLAATTAFTVQIVEIQDPQQSLDKATDIISLISEIHEKEQIEVMNNDEANYKAQLSAFLKAQLKLQYSDYSLEDKK